jgi:SSS family solute:Na+ symporter
MNALDYVVLLGTMLGIALYGMWRTRGHHNLDSYLRGSGDSRWFVVGLSVMATQASAVTFLSTPGQGFASGLGFIQIYFGMPIALIIIAVVFLPIYRRLNVITAYEYLGQRFDSKTRLLGAAVFLLQRGLGAGITIYAPAIVLSTVFGWRLDLTILCSGLVVIAYTVSGGSDAVNVTQKYQVGVIFAGMIAAGAVLLHKLPAGLHLTDALTLAGGMHKLQAVNFSADPRERYTLWSGVLGATFLMLAYFGADQSQVQRYISGASLRESRLGLMFNAVFKIPMQFFILSLGVLLFLFYQFELPPVYFNRVEWKHQLERGDAGRLQAIETDFAAAHDRERLQLETWLAARRAGDSAAEAAARAAVSVARARVEAVRAQAEMAVDPAGKKTDTDYVFITFILDYLPHGIIGLLIATFFAAALSAKAAELNALGAATTVDLYRHVIKRQASDAHCLAASKWFTIFWGLVSISFALSATLAENLIQAVNIVGSIFYPAMLGLFVVGFFLRRIGGTAVFWGALATQVLVIALFFSLNIGYLWYNLIGCAACVLFSVVFQAFLGPADPRAEALPNA